VSSDGTDVWVANFGEETVSEIDASSGTVIRTIYVGKGPYGVSSDGTHVWVSNSFENTVSEIEASNGHVIRTIHVGDSPYGVYSDGTHVWVANNGENTVSEIDAASGTVILKVHVGSGPVGVSSDGTHVWVANDDEDTVSELPIALTATCISDGGTITLSPGLTDTAAVQTLKIKGTFSECNGETFTGVSYTATLKTEGAVSCSVLSGASEVASGSAKFKWTPKARPSTGTLNLPLTETPVVALSGGLTAGTYSPLSLAGSVSEKFTGGSTCGVPVGTKPAKAVKKGTFTGSAVAFE
jgi:YVTN family beta-propeller protein